MLCIPANGGHVQGLEGEAVIAYNNLSCRFADTAKVCGGNVKRTPEGEGMWANEGWDKVVGHPWKPDPNKDTRTLHSRVPPPHLHAL